MDREEIIKWTLTEFLVRRNISSEGDVMVIYKEDIPKISNELAKKLWLQNF